LIGFQLDRYLENFAQCVEKTLGEKVNGDRLTLGNHQTVLKTFPISIDFDQFHQWATQPQAEREMQTIRSLLNLPPEGFVGIGVDRLEYTKALLERFQAIDLFFTRYPQYKGKFTFVQVAPTSRAEMEVYQDYAEKVRALIEEINGRHACDGWKPIHFQQEKLSHATLALYYRMADLAIISSTADGMNLVAKEYVASQVDEKGLLLLSEMAGASEQLEGAFLINPYNIEGVCEAIRTALGTPHTVRRLLMRRMREQVRDYTLYRWVGENFSTLETFKRR
ncbi:MAG TPA: trehalose-6-phosphate synthase, partial [Nitrospiria bacterium]|nr:trehalose-6-phosphate synthase [Nitrospiria bacterium]